MGLKIPRFGMRVRVPLWLPNNGDMAELAYALVLGTRYYRFESYYPYQILPLPLDRYQPYEGQNGSSNLSEGAKQWQAVQLPTRDHDLSKLATKHWESDRKAMQLAATLLMQVRVLSFPPMLDSSEVEQVSHTDHVGGSNPPLATILTLRKYIESSSKKQ